MKVTLISVTIGALGTVSKVLLKRLEQMEIGRAKTVKSTALLRSTRILRNGPGDLRALAVIQTLLSDHVLRLYENFPRSKKLLIGYSDCGRKIHQKEAVKHKCIAST